MTTAQTPPLTDAEIDAIAARHGGVLWERRGDCEIAYGSTDDADRFVTVYGHAGEATDIASAIIASHADVSALIAALRAERRAHAEPDRTSTGPSAIDVVRELALLVGRLERIEVCAACNIEGRASACNVHHAHDVARSLEYVAAVVREREAASADARAWALSLQAERDAAEALLVPIREAVAAALASKSPETMAHLTRRVGVLAVATLHGGVKS